MVGHSMSAHFAHVIQWLPYLVAANECRSLHNIAQSQRNQRTYRNVLIQVPAASCSNLLTQVSRKQLLGQLQAYNYKHPGPLMPLMPM
jgi:hypothetical protein